MIYRRFFLPLDVRFHRAMARFAAHAHFRHGGVVAIRFRFVIFSQAGVVTRGAHRIPVHPLPRPVAPVAGGSFILVTVYVEPFIFCGIQSDIARLQASAGSWNEKLAQGIVANDAHHGKGVAFFIEAEGENFCEAIRVDKCFGGVLAVSERFFRRERGVVFFFFDKALGATVVRSVPFFEGGGVALAA